MQNQSLLERVDNQLNKLEQEIKERVVNESTIYTINCLIEEIHSLIDKKEKHNKLKEIIKRLHLIHGENLNPTKVDEILLSFENQLFKLRISNPSEKIYRRGFNTENSINDKTKERYGIGHYCAIYSERIQKLSRQEYRDIFAVLTSWPGLLNGELIFQLKPGQVLLEGITAPQSSEDYYTLAEIEAWEKYNNFSDYKAFKFNKEELEQLRLGIIEEMYISEYREGKEPQIYILSDVQINLATLEKKDLLD